MIFEKLLSNSNNNLNAIITGNSMRPILQDKEYVSVYLANLYFPGDILVFKYKSGLIIHRLLKITEGRYFAKGDNSFRIEDFSIEDVIGKVIVPYDLNNNPEFIDASWKIGKLFKGLGYSKEKILLSKEYQKYKEEYIDRICAALILIRHRSKRFVYELPDISSFNYALIKGEALSVQAYGKPGTRISCDVDFLISQNQLSLVEDRFLNSGFCRITDNRTVRISMQTMSHQSVPLAKDLGAIGTCSIDLNFDLFWGEYEGERIDIDDFLSDSCEIEVYGKRLKVLPPEKAFIQLALHHYKDMNSIFLLATRANRWRELLSDAYCLLKRNSKDISVMSLLNTCKKYRIDKYIYFILYHIGAIFNDELISGYIHEFESDEGKQLLSCYGLCDSERKKWKCDLHTRLASENHFHLIENDLSEEDMRKISINKQLFLRSNEQR